MIHDLTELSDPRHSRDDHRVRVPDRISRFSYHERATLRGNIIDMD